MDLFLPPPLSSSPPVGPTTSSLVTRGLWSSPTLESSGSSANDLDMLAKVALSSSASGSSLVSGPVPVVFEFAQPLLHPLEGIVRHGPLNPLHLRLVQRPRSPLSSTMDEGLRIGVQDKTRLDLSPLMLACSDPLTHVDTVRTLVSWGAEPRDRWLGNTLTSLNFAVMSLNLPVVRFFVEELEMDPSTDGRFCWNPWHFALAVLNLDASGSSSAWPHARAVGYCTLLESLMRYWSLKLYRPFSTLGPNIKAISELETTDLLSRLVEMIQYLVDACRLDPNELSAQIANIDPLSPETEDGNKQQLLQPSFVVRLRTAISNFIHPNVTRTLTSRLSCCADLYVCSVPDRLNPLELVLFENRHLFRTEMYRKSILSVWFAEFADDLMAQGCRFNSGSVRRAIAARRIPFIVIETNQRISENKKISGSSKSSIEEMNTIELSLECTGRLFDPLLEFSAQTSQGTLPEPFAIRAPVQMVNAYSGYMPLHELSQQVPQISPVLLDFSAHYFRNGMHMIAFVVPGRKYVLKVSVKVALQRSFFSSAFMASHRALEFAFRGNRACMDTDLPMAHLAIMQASAHVSHIPQVLIHEYCAFEPLGVSMVEMYQDATVDAYVRLRSGSGITVHQPIPFARKRMMALSIIKGLAAMHRAGVLHGDISENNVYISTKSDHAKLGDLSASMALNSNLKVPFPHMASNRLCSLFSRPPEGHVGSPQIEASWDIWSLGVVLFSLFFEVSLFSGAGGQESQMLPEMCRLIGHPGRQWVEQHIPLIPPGFDARWSYSAEARANLRLAFRNWESGFDAEGSVAFEHRILAAMHMAQIETSNPIYLPKEEVSGVLRLISRCLRWDPTARSTAKQLLSDPFFESLSSIADNIESPPVHRESQLRNLRAFSYRLALRTSLAPSVVRAISSQCPHLGPQHLAHLNSAVMNLFCGFLISTNGENIVNSSSKECARFAYDPILITPQGLRLDLSVQRSLQDLDGTYPSYWLMQTACAMLICAAAGLEGIRPWSQAIVLGVEGSRLDEVVRAGQISIYAWRIGQALGWKLYHWIANEERDEMIRIAEVLSSELET